MSGVFDALLAAADRTARPFPEVLRHHLLEAVLRRLPADGFVLRGSLLTRVWAAPFPRPAADLDFVGTFAFDAAATVGRFAAGLGRACGDGVRVDPAAVTGTPMWLHTAFPGVRVTIPAEVFGGPATATADVGFGDPLVPPAERIAYPVVVGEPVPVWAVHPATLVGWKLHGLIEWGERRWRAKDVLDLWLLTRPDRLPTPAVLAEAIGVAFTSRGCPTADARRALAPDRWAVRSAQARWDRFRRDRPDDPMPESLEDVVAAVRDRLEPAVAASQ